MHLKITLLMDIKSEPFGLVCFLFFLKESNNFIEQECIKLIRHDKDFYINVCFK